MILKDGKWIRAVMKPQAVGKKTQTYTVESTFDCSMLGFIGWYSPWRSYAFYPNDGCVFEPKCLETICEWIRVLNAEQKARLNENHIP